jgi:hypothetical protein
MSYRGLTSLVSLTVGVGVFYLASRATRALSPREPVRGELEAVNDAFHRVYGEKSSSAELEAPVMVVLADTLVVHHRGERRQAALRNESFDVLKSVAHLPVAAYAALHEPAADGAPALDEERLRDLLAHASSVSERLPAALHAIGTDAAQAANALVNETVALLERAQASVVPRARLTRFARKMGRLLLTLTHAATELQLSELHRAVEEALSRFSPVERRRLQVIVTGDHQARTRSLAMQYFQARLGEAPGEDTRVAFGEGISDEKAALALVGTRRLDFTLARAFFADEKRLQRDVLGDAARDILVGRKLSRIGVVARKSARKRGKR